MQVPMPLETFRATVWLMDDGSASLGVWAVNPAAEAILTEVRRFPGEERDGEVVELLSRVALAWLEVGMLGIATVWEKTST